MPSNLSEAAEASQGPQNPHSLVRDGLEAPLKKSHRHRSKKAVGQHWTRVVHVYTSMACFLVVLFFSVTGLTLNHPTWTLGGAGSETTEQGSLPTTWKSNDTVNWLTVAEFLRSEHSLRGAVSNYQSNATDGSITFKGPGYEADAFIDVAAGSYEITIASQGPLGALNDLHKGRDSSSSWRWLIDASAILLIVISLSGLILQLFLRRRRRNAMWAVGGGSIILVVMAVLALR